MRYLYICLCLVLYALPAQAASIEAEIQKKYQSVNNMKSQFVQKLVHRESNSIQERKGQLLFQKPLEVRWETESPHAELLLITAEEVWNYLPDEEVAYKYNKDVVKSSRVLIEVITGQARLDEDFGVKNLGKEHALIALDLFPHEPTPEMVEARVWVDEKTKLIQRARITDFYGNTNELSFTKVDINVSLPKESFSFTPPEGIDVEDNSQ